MLGIGIPVYKAKKTLPAALDSLVVQTKKNFITYLSIDGDGEDYSDIINTYTARGLKIKVIYSAINHGPGTARQLILDTTQCDYIMFLDADDLLMPRAAEILYSHVKKGNFDIIKSSFIKENSDSEDILLRPNVDNILTWFHGKIYKTKYLRDNNIYFLPDLRVDEDAYFNAVAWNSTENKATVDEVTYIWRDNKDSITRARDAVEYFKETYHYYIYSQVEALKKIFQIAESVPSMYITNTLLNIYYYYMKARFYKLDESVMDNYISTLKEERWMSAWINAGENWFDIISNIKPGNVYEGQYVVFYDETFNLWAKRLLRR